MKMTGVERVKGAKWLALNHDPSGPSMAQHPPWRPRSPRGKVVQLRPFHSWRTGGACSPASNCLLIRQHFTASGRTSGRDNGQRGHRSSRRRASEPRPLDAPWSKARTHARTHVSLDWLSRYIYINQRKTELLKRREVTTERKNEFVSATTSSSRKTAPADARKVRPDDRPPREH